MRGMRLQLAGICAALAGLCFASMNVLAMAGGGILGLALAIAGCFLEDERR